MILPCSVTKSTVICFGGIFFEENEQPAVFKLTLTVFSEDLDIASSSYISYIFAQHMEKIYCVDH